MDDILLMMKLAGSYDRYLTKSSRLGLLRFIGAGGKEIETLEWECWTLRRDAYKALAEVYDGGGSEDYIRFWCGKWGWTFDQLGKDSIRAWLCKNAEDPHDPNPVEAEHVYVQMAKNFPPDAIEWVKRARWTGPVEIPWERIDQDDRDEWAASHQPEKVRDFQRQIEAHDGHVAPSILVQEPGSQKAFIVDGHHRALARENLKQNVLAYVGNIDPQDRRAALETHTRQIHQGNDPQNA